MVASDDRLSPAGRGNDPRNKDADGSRPNIVLVLADDLGFSDIGCYGGEIRTPTLDRLAREGVRMSNFYASPRCSPSRASLLTGRHPHEVGIGVLTADDRPRGYAGSLDPTVPTIAQLLSEVGYTTCLSGKWHLASDTATANESWPTRCGFQDFYGMLVGAGSYYQPRTLHRGEERIDEEAFNPDFFLTGELTSHAVEFVHRSVDAQEPFFLYLAYTAPHWPLHAAVEDVARYRGCYDAGWDVLRAQRLEKLEELGLLPPGTRPCPRDAAVPAWSDEPFTAWQSQRMEVYAAQVEAMDRGIGEVVAVLEQTDQLERTLIIFLSDNGACAESLPIEPSETFLRKSVICPPMTRDGRTVRIGNTPDIVPGPEDTYASYGRAWANLSNAPFRLYKRWVHEGGIASPLVAHWPHGQLEQGGIAHQPAQLTDIVPTILAAAMGDELSSRSPQGGVSLLSLWRKGAVARSENVSDAVALTGEDERSLYWEHIGNAAIRRSRWKLVREVGGAWELYDMVADRTELDDLADQQPEVVAELAADWQRWADEAGVIPWPEVLDGYRERGRPVTEASG